MTNHKIDLRTLAQEADDAFWQVVVRYYPEATTGDLSPLTTFRLHQAAEAAIAEWIWANVPDARPPTTPTFFNESDGHTYWLNEKGDLVAAPTMQDGTVDWDDWIYVDEFDVPLSGADIQRILAHLRGDDASQ
jgi:hypothetical protein